MNVFSVLKGDSPIVLGQPHVGTFVPDDLFARLNPRGRGLDDTDWHINRLYSGLLAGATVVQSHIHRYVIDANRDPEGTSLYPGQNTTTLCPLIDFDGVPIWAEGQAPSEDEIMSRRDAFHTPYHRAVREQLDRVKARHGVAIFYDCHSIRSNISFLFDGVLPDFCIGTNNGKTCSAKIENATDRICRSANGYDTVLNGRFKGGWSTQHYGRPNSGVHAIQMELAQKSYMHEFAPWKYRNDLASGLRQTLAALLSNLEKMALEGTV